MHPKTILNLLSSHTPRAMAIVCWLQILRT
jgi:hypothetical protein